MHCHGVIGLGCFVLNGLAIHHQIVICEGCRVYSDLAMDCHGVIDKESLVLKQFCVSGNRVVVVRKRLGF